MTTIKLPETGAKAQGMVPIELPRSMRIGPHVYTVYWSEADWERLRTREDGLGHLMGRTEHFLSEIYIRPNLSMSQKRDTLLHEILHCVFSSGTGVDLANVTVPDMEEYICSVATPWLLGVLRDNPEIHWWLTAEDTR